MSEVGQLLDTRRAADLVAAILRRRAGYLEQFRPGERSPGRALVEIDARFLEAVLGRLNRAPEKNKLAFLELLGIGLVPAQVARAPIVFTGGEQAADARAPEGARVAAPPPEGSSRQVVFETESTLGLTAARLEQVVSLWPGRDQWIDHSEALAAGEPVRPFRREELVDTPHHLYLAHDTLLALAGVVRVDVEFELSQPGSEDLAVVWEYWDGKVWRGFLRQRPECAEVEEEVELDATRGLTRSGKLRLESECAEAAKVEVDGVEAFWIRGRLDEPLPPDPGQILPEIAQLRLSTVIEQPLDVVLAREDATYERPEAGSPQLVCVLVDGDGRPIDGALVELLDDEGSPILFSLKETGDGGTVTFPLDSDEPVTLGLEIGLFDATFVHPVRYEPLNTTDVELRLQLTLQLGGLQPDSAFADAQELDLTRPFYPFGQQPQPGSTFFVQVDEAFSKPGARVELHVRSTETPQDRFDVTTSGSGNVKTHLSHTITWQYWNGRQWAPLLPPHESAGTAAGSPEALTASGEFSFDVPEDFATRHVEEKDGYWIRARLASGAFGFSQKVAWEDGSNDNEFVYVIHQPPALSDLRLSYTWTRGPYHAERVLAFNDFAYIDHTDQAKWPGEPFQPFTYLADTLPALYLGFSGKLPVDRLGIYLDVVEDPSLDFAPVLEWEFHDGAAWRSLTATDETRDLRYAGILSFSGSPDAAASPRFGEERYFVRARQKEDGPPAEPELRALLPNAVWASQWETTANEVLGTSNGQPRQAFALRNAPVLEGERIEVRELLGRRAEVEWRAVAAEVLAGEDRALAVLEERLAREGRETEVEVGPVRLRRDRDKRVVELWVEWRPRPHLRASEAEDRHYVIDRGGARLRFGDGERGRIPPLGAEVLAREYRAGGGSTGNVAQGRIDQLLAGIPGVDGVSNARPAEGGADEETLASVSRRGPRSLRHRGRALLAADFEVMAYEASPAVAVARAWPGRDPRGRERPGWVTLTIIPRSDEPRPWPSVGLRDKVRRHLEARTDASLAAGGGLQVVGPDYLAVDVEATVAPTEADAAGEAADAARATVAHFLHPLQGGPEGRGWTPGRDLFLSDLCVALERTPGIDFVSEVQLRVNSRTLGESVDVGDQRVVLAGEIVIRIDRGES